METEGSVVTAETIILFQRMQEARQTEGGPWFGLPIRGFTVSETGIPYAPIYFLASLSGPQGLRVKATLQVESPTGRRMDLRTIEFDFGAERTAIARGPLEGFEVDAPGDYSVRLIFNDAIIARTYFYVIIDPCVEDPSDR